MYTIESGEHFEDWYVACGQTHAVESFDDAIQLFHDECMSVINDVSSGSGIDQYIAENHQDQNEEDSGWASEYSKGFWFTITADDNEVLNLHLDYDPKTKSISRDAGFNFHREGLSSSEITKIQDSIVAIRDSLTNRKA